jgi:hypothetical protein
MTRGTAPADTGSATVFELERFEWTAPDRLEVSGRWSGLRAHRFVRPTLTLEGQGGQKRLLALLEHKPWPAEDGQPWVAAFPWEGEKETFESADLAVATGIEVSLPPPEAKAPRKKTAAARAKEAEAKADEERLRASELLRSRDGVASERDEALSRVRILEHQLESVRQAHQTALQESRVRERKTQEAADERVAQMQTELERERQSLQAERERDRKAIEAEYEAVLREHESRAKALEKERDAAAQAAARDHESTVREAARERESAVRDALRDQGGAVDSALQERDAALRERDRAASERTAMMRERDTAIKERDAAVRERGLAQAQRMGPPRTGTPPVQAPLEVWAPRLVAVAILCLLFVVVVMLLHAS